MATALTSDPRRLYGFGSCLPASEEALFDDGVNAPITIHELCHAEVNGNGDQANSFRPRK